jgi:hypothetical protein
MRTGSPFFVAGFHLGICCANLIASLLQGGQYLVADST